MYSLVILHVGPVLPPIHHFSFGFDSTQYCVSFLLLSLSQQDDTYTESYISTIGVDFVSIICVCFCVFIEYKNMV